MKTIFSTGLLLGFLTIGAQADVMQLNGAFPGNDNEANVEAAIFDATGVAVDLTLYAKSDDDPDLVVVTGTQSGTWNIVDPAVFITYVSVKAGPNFTVWEYNPAENFGTWTTAGLTVGNGPNGANQPDLSHLSFWLGDNTGEGGDPGGDVPEPASMALFGGGLVGLAVLARRRRK